MKQRRLLWFVIIFGWVLGFFSLMGQVTQPALMQSEGGVVGDTAVNMQEAANELIPDGSFEERPSLWMEVDDTGCLPWIRDWFPITQIPAYDGSQYFRGGGTCFIDQTDVVNNNSASQIVTIPPDTPALSFWYWADRTDPDTLEDFAYVKVNNADVWNYALIQANNTNQWVNEILDLSDFAGQTVPLEFSVQHGTGSDAGNMMFDFVEFTEPAQQTWTVSPESGGNFSYTTASGKPITDLSIPAGAVEKETIISYKPALSLGVPLNSADETPLGGGGLTFVGPAFDLEAYNEFIYLPLIINNKPSTFKREESSNPITASPTDTDDTNSFQFNMPIKITIHYNEEELMEMGIEETEIYLYYWTGEGWEDAASTCPVEDWIDPHNNTYIRDTDNDWFALNVCHFTRFGTVG